MGCENGKLFLCEALVVGTRKDLMEAVAAHAIQELWGSYPYTANFPNILGQAFVTLYLTTTDKSKAQSERQGYLMERSLYEAACSINTLLYKSQFQQMSYRYRDQYLKILTATCAV